MMSIPDEKDQKDHLIGNAGCAELEKRYPNRKGQLANKNDGRKCS